MSNTIPEPIFFHSIKCVRKCLIEKVCKCTTQAAEDHWMKKEGILKDLKTKIIMFRKRKHIFGVKYGSALQ